MCHEVASGPVSDSPSPTTAATIRLGLSNAAPQACDNTYTKRQHDEIVCVLTDCKGRVGGADGAAIRMGLSRTTLISRMKRLGINPYDYA